MKWKIKLQKDFLIFLIFIFISFLLYFQYIYTKKNLIENFKTQEYAKTLQIKEKFKSVLNRVEIIFKTKLNENLKVLNRVYTMYKDIDNFDVDKIASILNKDEKEGHYEVFVIDKNYKIIKASYKPDLGLNLGKFEKYKKIYEEMFNQKKRVDISYLIFDYSSFTLKRYFLILSPDKKYLLELAYAVDIYPMLKKIYYYFLDKYRDLKKINLYFMDKYLVYPVDFNHRFKPKLPIENIVKNTKKFFLTILNISNSNESFENLGNRVLELFYTHNNILSKMDLKNHIYITYTLTEGFFKNLSNRLIIKNIFSTYFLEKDLESIRNRFLIMLFFVLLLGVSMMFLIYYISKKIKDLVDHMNTNKPIEKPNSFIKELDDLVATYNEYRNRLNKEIDKNKKLLMENKRFIVDTVHQLKTPLSIITLNSDFLKMQINNKEIEETLDEIEAAIAMLTNSYEDLSYLAAQNTVDYKPVKLNVSEILKQRINFFIPLAKARNKRFVVDIDDDIYFNINKVELERLIDNNISNAIDYSKGKEIKIVLKKLDNEFILRFESFGDRIKNPDKLFEKNYREHSHKRGLGIGLNIVKKVCEKYGIKYKVFSEEGKNIFEYRFLLQL